MFTNDCQPDENGVQQANVTVPGFHTPKDAMEYAYDIDAPQKCHTINVYDQTTGEHWSYDHEQDFFEKDEEDSEPITDEDREAVQALFQKISGGLDA
jgi:hypothetical protein